MVVITAGTELPSSSSTWAPITGVAQKQSAMSDCTTEAELVALAKMVKSSVGPLQDLWETLLGRPVQVICEEDNSAAITVTQAGYSPALRCMKRQHSVSIAKLHEYFEDGTHTLQKCPTEEMAADGFTKAFMVPAKWAEVVSLLGLRWYGKDPHKWFGAAPSPPRAATIPTGGTSK